MIKHFNGWQGEAGINNVVPQSIGQWPEGKRPDLWPYFKLCAEAGIADQLKLPAVLDVGCGYGRLAQCFPPEYYKGVDINAAAILKAKAENPDHTFEHITAYDQIPSAVSTLLYFVCYHVPDDEIEALLQQCAFSTEEKIVIVETTGPRTNGNKDGPMPGYRRHASRYAEILFEFGFSLDTLKSMPYAKSGDFVHMIFRRTYKPDLWGQ